MFWSQTTIEALRAEGSEGKTLAELNLMTDKVGCIWLKDVPAQDYPTS